MSASWDVDNFVQLWTPICHEQTGYNRSAQRDAGSMDESEKAKVYIVDDDPSVRQAIEWLLSSVNLPCESFGSSAEFLDRAAKGLAGCVVLDIRMPGLSGLDVQQALTAAGHEVPVIFVSAHADVALTVRAMKAGALEVLTKPFDDQALLDAVK